MDKQYSTNTLPEGGAIMSSLFYWGLNDNLWQPHFNGWRIIAVPSCFIETVRGTPVESGTDPEHTLGSSPASGCGSLQIYELFNRCPGFLSSRDWLGKASSRTTKICLLWCELESNSLSGIFCCVIGIDHVGFWFGVFFLIFFLIFNYHEHPSL